MNHKIKKRSDYKPLFWLAKDTYLDFLIFNNYTIVKSEIIFQKNNTENIINYDLDSYLELNGVDLVTKKFELILDDNLPKDIKIENLNKKNEAVIIPVPCNTSIVKINTDFDDNIIRWDSETVPIIIFQDGPGECTRSPAMKGP